MRRSARAEAAEDRADALEAAHAEVGRCERAELGGSLAVRVVGGEVAGGSVDAVAFVGPGSGGDAEVHDLRRVLSRVAGGVPPVGLETRRHPAPLDLRAQAGGAAEVVAVRLQDARRDHQVAVEAVALRHGRVAGVDEVARLHPRCLEADGGAVRGVRSCSTRRWRHHLAR